MTIQLHEQWTDLVRRKMEEGGYESAEDVVDAAMRLLREREATELESLRRGIAAGMADIEAGRVRPFDESVLAEIKERGRQRLTAYRNLK